ncbi:hypothetical protein FQN51_002501 [Onygenales sp. PD_10]|nr:hypothetical protein FQN51_002501 [Onygenales sp. PD_10]
MAVITIDIFSDVICPWCFIGYLDLKKAISLYQKTYPGGSKDDFQLSWKPYFLDQEEPKERELINDRMHRRMDAKMVHGAQTRLQRIGAGLGVDFKFGGYIGSSRLAHRLLHIVEAEMGGVMQSKVSEMLFRYQLEREEDVSQLETLVKAGVEAGLEEGVVRGWLGGEGEGGRWSGLGEVIEEEAKGAREGEVKGVPHYVIGGKHHIDGAVDIAEFFEKVVEVREGRGGEGTISTGIGC